MPITTDFLGQLDRFSIIVNKRVTSSFVGPRRSISAGRGMTFKDHRIYSPGDDFRAIDWRVFARTDDLYIKNYEEERNLNIHILLDSSASMNFGKPDTKFEYAAMLSAGLAYLSIKANEKFTFSNFADTMSIFKPKKGRSNLISMVDYLNNVKVTGSSQLRQTVTKYSKLIGSKSLVILLSDFMMDLDEIEDTLPFLSRNTVKVIQVLDPIEAQLKMLGDYNLIDSEIQKKLRLNISPHLRQKYLEKLRNHNIRIEKFCNDLRYKYSLVTTDMPVFDAFYKILE